MDHPVDPGRLDVPKLLKDHDLKPNKRLGQNFLIDPHYLNLVADAGKVTQQDTVLEIGAGIGNLTRLLGAQARQVIAVEIDADLIPILVDTCKDYPSVKVIHGDILAFEVKDLVGTPTFQVIANIPYYITSKIIRHLMTGEAKPDRIILTVQKEVADRICAPPGKISLLSLSVLVFGKPSVLNKIPAGAFYPPPQVDSAIVKINMLPSPLIPIENLETFFLLARAGFSQKRKNLRNSLSAGLGLDKRSTEQLLQSVNIDFRRRAETLTIDEWKSVTTVYKNKYSPKN